MWNIERVKRKFLKFLQDISLKKSSQGKKNAVAERFNIYSGKTHDIIENNITADIENIILGIPELTKSKKYRYLLRPHNFLNKKKWDGQIL